MPYKEREIEKIFYSIGEVAKMFDVNTSHIRFWSKQFDIIKPATNKKGNRMYTMVDIENFKVIYHLVKEKGFTLKGAKIEMHSMRKKMKLASQPKVETMVAVETELPFDEQRLADLQPESDISPVQNDLVDKIALKNSLGKLRASLLQLNNEIEKIEV
jgi:DNA-binding transcriptional MerR regulator